MTNDPSFFAWAITVFQDASPLALALLAALDPLPDSLAELLPPALLALELLQAATALAAVRTMAAAFTRHLV
jgi:hypothetical protein